MRQPIIRALTIAGVLAVVAPAAPSLGAQYGTIDPQVLATAKRIDGAQVVVTPKDEAVTLIGPSGNVDPVNLRTRTRAADGTLGPLQGLSIRANADPGRRAMTANAAGDVFAPWGIATSTARGQWAERPAGGLFGPTTEFGQDGTSPPCTRFIDAEYDRDGGLLLACSTDPTGVFPNDKGMLITTRQPGASSWGGSSLRVSGSSDNFIIPRVATGADGTRAVAWSWDDSPKKLQVAVAPPGQGLGASLTLATGAAVELSDVAVLGDGTVAVVYADAAGTQLRVRPPGSDAAAPFQPAVVLSAAPVGADIEPDGAGGAALLAWSEQAGPDNKTIVASRPAGGPVGEPQTLETSPVTFPGVLRVGSDGTAALMRFRDQPTPADPVPQIGAWVRPPGGSFGGPHPIGEAPSGGQLNGRLDVDRFGDVVAAWSVRPPEVDAAATAFLGGLDRGAPPTLGPLNAPATTLAGESAAFSITAADTSGVSGIRWSFGDGAGATGGSVTHTFAAPGDYEVTAVATDRAGNQATATAKVRVVAAATQGTDGADRKPPRVTLTVPRRVTLRALLAKGLTVTARADEPSRFDCELRGRAASARVAAPPFNLVLGRATVRRATTTRLRLRVSRKLIGRSKPRRVQVRLTATDAAGNQRVVTRSLAVR